MIPSPATGLIDLAAALLALAVLVLADRHRAAEEEDDFGFRALRRFGLVTGWVAWSDWIPTAAFSVVALGISAGFLGHPWGFALAAAFVIADKLLSHELLDLPGDTGWAGATFACALLALRFDLWGAVVGAGMLAGFLGGLWALGKVRGWSK